LTTVWFDKVKACVGWGLADRARIAKLRRCLDPGCGELIQALAEQLAQFKDAQSLMSNARYVQRLHAVLHEWLTGLLAGTFDDEHVKARWAFGQRLLEVDLSFEDVILLENLTRMQLSDVAQEQMDESPQAMLAAVNSLNKALCLDLTLIHNGYLQVREGEMERAILDRFLAITGFSRTLFENLAEAREWTQMEVQSASVP